MQTERLSDSPLLTLFLGRKEANKKLDLLLRMIISSAVSMVEKNEMLKATKIQEFGRLADEIKKIKQDKSSLLWNPLNNVRSQKIDNEFSGTVRNYIENTADVASFGQAYFILWHGKEPLQMNTETEPVDNNALRMVGEQILEVVRKESSPKQNDEEIQRRLANAFPPATSQVMGERSGSTPHITRHRIMPSISTESSLAKLHARTTSNASGPGMMLANSGGSRLSSTSTGHESVSASLYAEIGHDEMDEAPNGGGQLSSRQQDHNSGSSPIIYDQESFLLSEEASQIQLPSRFSESSSSEEFSEVDLVSSLIDFIRKGINL
ncbi:LOW QUALITY PROTEIN: hypothetical protein CVT25_008608 [Psilocybe cyanescens]|uniref:Uncharacterized protein n=1 Tax=Psilocybe cyanescens TaxID=93625 RepID=A0A409XND7_PSICY|nr:LOW QUALITY PROTEIN: hypothetical protein CVT25_008608 [Psilocybe cyanescens]